MPLLDIILGYGCNLSCDYCTITPQMRQRSLPAQTVANALAQGRRDGFDHLSITGGEPTIFDTLLPLVRHARTLGYEDIKVQSNGLLWTPPNVARAIDAGVTRFAVSIHAHRRERYEAIVQRSDTYDAMVAGLRTLVQASQTASIHVSADVIVMRSTLPDLADAIAWLADVGLRHADLWFVSLTDGNAANVESMPAMTEAMPAIRAALAEGRRRGMNVRSLHVPRCLLGADRAHAFDPASVGVRVLSPDASFDLAHSRITGQVHVPACVGCEHESYCPGLREDYLARYGDAEVAAARSRAPSRTGAVRLPVM